MFVYTGRVHARVHGPSCTWQVGLPGHVHIPRRHATAVCGPSRPCTRPVHRPFTTVYTGTQHVTRPCTRPCTRHVTRPCTRPVRGRTTALYTPSSRARRIHGGVMSAYTCPVSPAHGPCTRRWTGRVDGPCIQLPTWPLRLHGPYTAIIPRQDIIPTLCHLFALFFICKGERRITL